MPLYEYECDACGNRFEQIQKFSDPPADACPKCGERKVHKLMSSPAIKFKGSGFYINDYAPKAAAGTDTKDSAPKGAPSQDTASKESSSSDSSKPSSPSGSADKAPATTTKSSSSGD
jgi:putative FmdB family regulatory protein